MINNYNPRYFEILYQNCFGTLLKAFKVSENEIPEEKDFGWNGCRLVDWEETDFEHFRRKQYRFFKEFPEFDEGHPQSMEVLKTALMKGKATRHLYTEKTIT